MNKQIQIAEWIAERKPLYLALGYDDRSAYLAAAQDQRDEATIARANQRDDAQSELMSAMQVAFDNADDDVQRKEMDKQFKRVERLFDYTPGSWHRGS